MQLEISSQEVEFLADVLESWCKDAHAEAHHTLDTKFKRELKDKLHFAEGLKSKLDASVTSSTSV